MHQATNDTARANEKSTENAVCILRNLSYRLAAEVPDLQSQHEETMSTDSEFIDCFGNWRNKSKKSDRIERESAFPRSHAIHGRGGAETDGLYHPSIIRSYLQLMMETQNSDTLEGLAGAIQNLTAGQWHFSTILREAVRAEKGLPVIVDLLK